MACLATKFACDWVSVRGAGAVELYVGAAVAGRTGADGAEGAFADARVL